MRPAVQQYLSEIKGGKSRKTHLAYSITLRGFDTASNARTLEELKCEDVLAYTEVLRDGKTVEKADVLKIKFQAEERLGDSSYCKTDSDKH